MHPTHAPDDGRWLFRLCLSRLGFSLINTAYAALIPLLQPAWGMSASQAGAVQSAWHAGYIVSLVAASLLAGRYGARNTFLGMGWAACASALVFALGAVDYASALILYGLAGLFAGGSYVPGLTLIAERFPPAARGRAMGAYIAAASLGYAVGLVGAGLLAERGGATAGFLLAAAGTLLGQALAVATLRGTANVVSDAGARGPLLSLASVAWLWRHKAARYVILGYTFHAWELLGMWAWLPAFLSAAAALHAGDGGTLVLAGAALAALTHLVSTAGSLFGGHGSDRWGRTPVILAMSLASIACALVFGWAMALPLGLLVALAVVFNLTAIGDSAIHSANLTEQVPAPHLATAYALRSILGFGMGVLAPWLFGRVLDAGGGGPAAWGWAWTLLGAVALAGPWATWRLQRLPRQ
ncbi:MFS transporter [Azospira restricta]|uniref:MFS transporter n=1 Tax=Azospira restricta TaxID=404405 RepID=A0A974Y3Y0_9RHOO|nr:MFS transporter [Azospira restricta]QRJ64158.1 MFS transporter [Azospira restricta]